MLVELNEASALLNSLETKLSDALIRRSYLVDSIADLPRPQERSIFDISPQSDPFIQSVNYIRCVNELREIRRKSEASVNSYIENTRFYEEARTTYDKRVSELHTNSLISPEYQAGLSKLSLEVLAAQKNRDKCEDEHIRLVREFDQLLTKSNLLRRIVEVEAKNNSDPRLRGISCIDGQIREEDKLIQSIRSTIERTKARYQGAMLRLDEVSNGIREMQNRSQHKQS